MVDDHANPARLSSLKASACTRLLRVTTREPGVRSDCHSFELLLGSSFVYRTCADHGAHLAPLPHQEPVRLRKHVDACPPPCTGCGTPMTQVGSEAELAVKR